MADRWWVLPRIGCELVAGLACHSSEWWWCREGLWVEEREEREKTEIKMNSVGLWVFVLFFFTGLAVLIFPVFLFCSSLVLMGTVEM